MSRRRWLVISAGCLLMLVAAAVVMTRGTADSTEARSPAASTVASGSPSAPASSASRPPTAPQSTGSSAAATAENLPTAAGRPPSTAAAERRRSPSLADYFDRVPAASPLRLGRVRERTGSYTSYDVRYRSDGLRITGVLNVPTGRGPFPAVVLAHGWADRDSYVRGQGMTRERRYLAERGFITLHVDYRGHGGSEDDPELVRQLYLGYAVDVLGAVSALRASDLPVDDDKIALMGRSMGGSVVLQALEMAPGQVAAGIVYSGQSSLEADNYRRWSQAPFDFGDEFAARHGTPAKNPAAWRAMSTRPYLARISEPVLMIHGTRDEQCPPRWARATEAALTRTGVNVRLRWYQGEHHTFEPRFRQSMSDSVAFLQDHLT